MLDDPGRTQPIGDETPFIVGIDGRLAHVAYAAGHRLCDPLLAELAPEVDPELGEDVPYWGKTLLDAVGKGTGAGCRGSYPGALPQLDVVTGKAP